MERAGIDLSVACSVATKPEMVESTHHWLENIRNPRILPFATMHPDLTMVVEEEEDLKKRGFKGFKIHPDYQGFFVDEKRVYPFYEAAQAGGMIVLFHAGLDRGLPDPIHSSPVRISKVHKDFPSLRMVVAHMGGEAVFDETIHIRQGCLHGYFVVRSCSPVLERFMKNILRKNSLRSDSP
jgi:predicted TIM-barrel fold metal-dependent hydrolase